MRVSAQHNNARISAQKARLVADMIRGKDVAQALNILAFSPKKGAELIKKVLESAIANAEHNNGADIDELKVVTIFVNKGPSLKRFQARAKGRGNRIEKQTCHIKRGSRQLRNNHGTKNPSKLVSDWLSIKTGLQNGLRKAPSLPPF